MLGDARLDEEQLSGYLRRAVEQSERSLHGSDAVCCKKRVGVGQDHRVPLAFQDARRGAYYNRGVGVVVGFSGDDAGAHSQDGRKLITYPLDTESCLPHSIRTTRDTRSWLLFVSAMGAEQGSFPSPGDERQIAVRTDLYRPAATT